LDQRVDIAFPDRAQITVQHLLGACERRFLFTP
jgi:hypothetical protein